MKTKILILLFAFSSVAVFAGVGEGSIDILKVPSGVKIQSMGGAYTAVSDDPEGIDSNPAGLSMVKNNQFLFMHDLYLDGVFFDSLYYAHGMEDGGTIAGALKFLSGGSIKQTNETIAGFYSGEGQDVAAVNFLAAAAYGINLSKWAYNDFNKNIDVGAALKFSGESIGSTYMNMGVSIDLGAIYTIVLEEADFLSNRGETIWNKIGIGAAIRNLGTSFESGITPACFALGAYTQVLSLFSSNNRLRINADFDYNMANSINVRAGLEFLQMFGAFSAAIRAGGNFSPEERLGGGVSIGAGFGMKTSGISYTLDYVFIPYSDFGSNQKIGLGISF